MKTSQSYFTMSEVNFFPPINLMYLATTLKQQGTHSVKILDADIEKKDYAQIAEEALQENPHVIGVTAFTLNFYDCMETIRQIKKVLPKVIICAGGPHTKYFAKETIEQPEIDYVLLGDAEYSFPELLNALEKKQDISFVKGVMYKKNKEVITTGPSNTIKDLDNLPFPSIESIDYMKYHSAIGNSRPVAMIIGSRGCPYQCTFCQSANTGYRVRSTKSMLDEIQHYLNHGIDEFMFYDDTFNITAQRVIDFSKGILEHGYKIKWSFRGRIDNVNEEMFRVAKESGLILMSYGVEDATDEGLTAVKRRQTLEHVYKGTALAKKYKVPISVNFIIGLPEHKTKEDARRIIKLAKKLRPDYCQLSIFIPHVGTGLYYEGIKKGILDESFWKNYARKPYKEAYIPFWEEHLTKQDLGQLIKEAYMTFYFDPFYMLQTLCNVKGGRDFLVKAKVGLHLFKLFVLRSFSSKASSAS
jgi:radical SAM superfamily enzyme YgiQ (UPF0313 family)